METAVRAAFSPAAGEKLVTGREGAEAQRDIEPAPSARIKRIKIISPFAFPSLTMSPIVINIRKDVNEIG